LAAYDAWAQDMLRDGDFTETDPDALREQCYGISDNGIILLMARKAAADYERFEFEMPTVGAAPGFLKTVGDRGS
jgi:hypothetical protein